MKISLRPLFVLSACGAGEHMGSPLRCVIMECYRGVPCAVCLLLCVWVGGVLCCQKFCKVHHALALRLGEVQHHVHQVAIKGKVAVCWHGNIALGAVWHAARCVYNGWRFKVWGRANIV